LLRPVAAMIQATPPNFAARYDRGNIVRLSVVVFAGLLSASCLMAQSLMAQTHSAESRKFHINGQRLQGTLEKLSEFGRNPQGGVTRIAYSDTDLAARKYVAALMEQAGLEVHTD